LYFRFILLFSIIISGIIQAQTLDEKVDYALDYGVSQIGTWLENHSNTSQHPSKCNSQGNWETVNRSSWVSGFFSGCLWYMYEDNENETFLEAAIDWTGDLESQKYNIGDHDVGFRMFCSYGNGLRLIADADYIDILIQSANSLATRYNPEVGCIRSWSWGSWNYPVIIDNMMNLELLFWASKNGGGQELYDIAVAHADKTRAFHIREDGSTYHVVDFNNDGSLRKFDTHQGYSTESCWSRGQAWGLYGYTVAFRETGEVRFGETAELLADYYIQNATEDHVPYSDYDSALIPNESKDASAAAIACSALLELSQLTGESKYLDEAEAIIYALTQPDYLSEGSGTESILNRACRAAGEDEESWIYTDYYFLEALVRYKQIQASVKTSSVRQIQLFDLLPNYPNPFNPKTVIKYRIQKNSDIHLDIYNQSGQAIRSLVSAYMQPGLYNAIWDGRNSKGWSMPSGVYIARLKFGLQVKSIKMVLLN